jgi:hypothetical protein
VSFFHTPIESHFPLFAKRAAPLLLGQPLAFPGG